MKRTALSRRTPLESRTPLRRRSRIRKRKATSRRRPEGYDDPEYIAWLEKEACRVTGKRGGNVAHHLRHTATGAPMGAHVKDDRRAITLAPDVHVPQLHGLAGFFKDWSVAQVQAWEDDQLKEQRSEWEKQCAR